MAFTEDLSAFFNTDEHAVEAYYDGGADPVAVIFDRAYQEALGIAGTHPVALGKAADFAAPVGKTLVISGTTYTIRNVEPQDDGATVLLVLEVA